MEKGSRLGWVPAFAGMTAVLVMASAGAALAHTGLEHAVSFAAGFKHPWTGLDHMLAMVAVGLWAGLNGGRALWAWPLAFVGLLIVAAVQLPIAAGAAIIALFALLHGHAHGSEVHLEAAAATHALGFVVATIILHGVGLAVAYVASGSTGRFAVRAAGALVAAAGLYLALAGGAGA